VGPGKEVLRRAANVRLVVFDVDGVLTDGRLFLSESGEETKCFHVRDGHGLVMLRNAGIAVAIISGRKARSVAKRMKELNIAYVYQGVNDKILVFDQLREKLKIAPAQVAYLGDDLPDLPVMRVVGLPAAVADAHRLVREQALWIASNEGGRGAARELCELILEAQGHLETAHDAYLATG
jgi:3-deoxy-D-manno-octulosonate 8-phosphate phosphatase (KDO 8-P phosphatase)